MEIFQHANVPVKFEIIPLVESKDIDHAKKSQQEVPV
jgi:hypothetical protein